MPNNSEGKMKKIPQNFKSVIATVIIKIYIIPNTSNMHMYISYMSYVHPNGIPQDTLLPLNFELKKA